MTEPGPLTGAPVMPFVAASSAERAKAFYAERLRLRVLGEDDFAVLFETAGAPLRAAIVPEVTPAPYTVLGWLVPNIEATAAILVREGVEMERFEALPQDEHGIWNAPGGDRVAWFRDLDGNLLSVTQGVPGGA